MFNYNHLYYFYVTAKSGGVGIAAKSLRIAQPSLSFQLKALERSLGVKLFTKVGRRLELSSEGKSAFAYCSSMFESANEFSDYLTKSKRVGRPKINIGVSFEIERPFISEIIGSVLKNKIASKVPLISLKSSNHDELFEKLKLHEIDFMFSNRPTYAEGTTVLSSIGMPVGLMISNAIAEKHGISSRTSIKEFLQLYPGSLALPSGDLKLRQEIDTFCLKNKIRRDVIFESDILASVNRAILEGVGFGFMPIPYVKREIEQNKILVLGSSKTLWSHNLTLLSLTTTKNAEISASLKNSLSKAG